MDWSSYYQNRPYFDKEKEQLMSERLQHFLSEYNIDFKTLTAIEIGAGHGIYTGIFIKTFKTVMAIEPNINLCKLLKSKYKKLQIYNKSIETLERKQTHDVAIFANVFLFIQDKNHILDKLSSLINTYVLIMEPAKFLIFEKKHKIQKKMTSSVIAISSHANFDLIFYGFIFKNQLCFLLKKKSKLND